MPSYLQDKNDGLVVESTRVSLDASKSGPGPMDGKIYESTRQLRQRDSGGQEAIMVQDRQENNAFYDRLIQDLADIETINTRVERDVEMRI